MHSEETNEHGGGDFLALGLNPSEIERSREAGICSRKDLAGVILTEGGEEMLSTLIVSHSTSELRQMLMPEMEALQDSVAGERASPVFFGVIEDEESQEEEDDNG
ncbi:MAG: hypothetical protein JJU00_20170 [Opitutales bacterium]|nr:hypothetical protein [Opitutales bacterium]